MENVIDEIREAEEKAQKRIAEAKKDNAARLNSAIEQAEEAKKEAAKRADEVVSQAIKDAEKRAEAKAQEMFAEQTQEIEKLKSRIEERMGTAIQRITAEFGKWQ